MVVSRALLRQYVCQSRATRALRLLAPPVKLSINKLSSGIDLRRPWWMGGSFGVSYALVSQPATP